MMGIRVCAHSHALETIVPLTPVPQAVDESCEGNMYFSFSWPSGKVFLVLGSVANGFYGRKLLALSMMFNVEPF